MKKHLYILIAIAGLLFLSTAITLATGLPLYIVTLGLGVMGLFSAAPKGSLTFQSFATQLLRKAIRDHSTLDMNKGQQKFEMRTNEIGVMSCYYEQRGQTLTPGDIAAIENLRTSQQALDLYLYQKRAPGTGNTRLRKGTGSADVATVVPSYFDPIEEGLDLSFVNQALRQYGSEGADKKQVIANAYNEYFMRNLPQIFRNIYTRANLQFLAHLEANKWALTGTADAGSIYTTYTGDAKNVPTGTPLTEIVQNMQIESRQNNFAQLGTPKLLHSPTAMRIINEYLARGSENSIDVKQFLNWFTASEDNEIIDATGDIATIYEIAAGGLAGYSRTFPWETHPRAEGGVVNTGEDEWSNMTIGGEDTMIFNGLPPVNLEVKTFLGYQDNSGTLPGNPDEGKIDIAENYSFVTQFGALRAYEADANISPILKHVIKA